MIEEWRISKAYGGFGIKELMKVGIPLNKEAKLATQRTHLLQ